MKLLAHIAFFDPGTRASSSMDSAAELSSKIGPTSKVSAFWRTFNYNAVTALLIEMDAAYNMFQTIDAVIDVNPSNGFQHLLRSWPPNGGRRRVHVQVTVHHNMSHPFRTTWAHRAHMQAHLEQYDWFLYTEGDVFVPASAVLAQTQLALPLYTRRHRPLGFTRMVNDSRGRLFFSDIRRPVSRSTAFSEPSLGTFAQPDNAYAASWLYPQVVMRAFVQSHDWYPVLRTTRGMREKAGVGWRSAGIVVRVDDPAPLRVFHVGKSGIFYPGNRHGFNSLPADQLVRDH